MTQARPDLVVERNAELARRYLVWLRDVRGRRAVTIYNYGSKLDSFLAHIGETPLADVTRMQMELWQPRQRVGRGRGGTGAPATQHKDVCVLRGLYGFLVAEGLMKRNPAALLGAPPIRNVNPRPISDDTWRRLWFANNLPAEARVVLGLGFFIGLRRAEIIGLAPHHVSTPALRLVSFPRKGGGDDITPYGEMLSVYADCLPHLICDVRSFLEPFHETVAARRGRGYLLSWGDALPAGKYSKRVHALPEGMADPQRIYRRLWHWQEAAGLARGAFSPHDMRHSTATNLLRAGVPIHIVSRLLNHSSIAMTMRYTKAGGDELAEWRRNRATRQPLTSQFNRM